MGTTSTESPCRSSDGNQTSYFEVYVNVTDEEETGKVTWIGRTLMALTPRWEPICGLQQFQPGAQLLASVTDPDGGCYRKRCSAANGWKWYRGFGR